MECARLLYTLIIKCWQVLNFPVALPTSNASRWFWSLGQVMKSFFSTLVPSFLKYMTYPKILLLQGSWRLFGTSPFFWDSSFTEPFIFQGSCFACVRFWVYNFYTEDWRASSAKNFQPKGQFLKCASVTIWYLKLRFSKPAIVRLQFWKMTTPS